MGRSSVLLIGVLTAAVLASGCNPFRGGKVKGHLESSGDTGTWVLDHGNCYSGQHEQYFGLIGYGPSGTGIAVKLVKDAVRGWSVVINQADTCREDGAEKTDCRAIVLSDGDCTTFKSNVTETHTTVNDITAVDGSLELECVNDAHRIKGKLTFDYCH